MAQGLTQAQVKELARLSKPTITAIENGDSGPRRVSVEALALALGLPPGAAGSYLNGDGQELESAAEVIERRAQGQRSDSGESPTRTRIVRASVDELMEMRALVREAVGEEAADTWLRAALQIREEHARGPAPAAEHLDAG